MGGMQGSVTYEGELTEFLPLLRFCEAVNLGKQTAFGLGRIEVEEVDGKATGESFKSRTLPLDRNH